MRKEFEKEDTSRCITESFCYTPEAVNQLYANIKQKVKKFFLNMKSDKCFLKHENDTDLSSTIW